MPPSEDSNRMVVVAAASSLQEADVLRATIQAEGIDCFIPGENAANILSYMEFGLHPKGVEVMVRSADAERAAAAIAAGSPRNRAPVAPPERLSSGVVAEELAAKAVKAAGLAVLVPPAVLWAIAFAFQAASLGRGGARSRSFRARIAVALGISFAIIVFYVVVVLIAMRTP